jgi:hypothetical protein
LLNRCPSCGRVLTGESCFACGWEPKSSALDALPPDEDLSNPPSDPILAPPRDEDEPLDLNEEAPGMVEDALAEAGLNAADIVTPEATVRPTAPPIEDPLEGLGDLDLDLGPASVPTGEEPATVDPFAGLDDPFADVPLSSPGAAADDPFGDVPLSNASTPVEDLPQAVVGSVIEEEPKPEPKPEPEPSRPPPPDPSDDDPLGAVSLLETADPFAAASVPFDPDFDPLATFDDIPGLDDGGELGAPPEVELNKPKPAPTPVNATPPPPPKDEEELSVDVDDMFDSIQMTSGEGAPVAEPEPEPAPAPAPEEPKAEQKLSERLFALAFALRTEMRDKDADLVDEAAEKLKGHGE